MYGSLIRLIQKIRKGTGETQKDIWMHYPKYIKEVQRIDNNR
jgi:hypothetical protein